MTAYLSGGEYDGRRVRVAIEEATRLAMIDGDTAVPEGYFGWLEKPLAPRYRRTDRVMDDGAAVFEWEG